MTTRIIFTGGGTAGHVTPNLALIEAIQHEGWQVDYIGSKQSVEEELIGKAGIPFHAISSGKMRRYFSWKNFLDPFKIFAGISQSFFLLRKLKADIVFSKGGFVAFPVVFAAWLNRIPVVAHESDMTPGLANRMSFPFVDKVCLGFAAAKTSFKNQNKVEVTGSPIRQQLFKGSRKRGLELCGFSTHKPTLLIMGGSLGSLTLNQIIRQALPKLTHDYQIIHLCGKGKIDQSLLDNSDYCQYEYVSNELADLYAASDLIISRAGANSLCEILALQKPHVLIPLSAKVSRGDQIHNANYFQQQQISVVVNEEQLSPETLIAAIEEVNSNKNAILTKIKALDIQSAATRILAIIKEQLHVESPKTV